MSDFKKKVEAACAAVLIKNIMLDLATLRARPDVLDDLAAAPIMGGAILADYVRKLILITDACAVAAGEQIGEELAKAAEEMLGAQR